jgi:proline iminopeptidase
VNRLIPMVVLAVLCAQSTFAVQTGSVPDHSKVPVEEEGAIPRDGFTLHYRAQGTGKPIVFLSGGPGMEIDYLKPAAKYFPSGYKLVFLEQRGTGRSRPEKVTAQNITLKLSVDDVEALRSHLQVKRIILAGHSYGGMLAMAYACAHSNHIDSMILIDSSGATLEYNKWFMENLQTREGPKRFFYDPSKASALLNFPALHEDVNHLMWDDLFKGYDLRSQLRKLRRPVLIIHGHQDPLGDKTAEDTHHLIRSSALEYLFQCGHFPWLEQPEEFRSILAAFLEKESPVSK